jgi:hypothetical protein
MAAPAMKRAMVTAPCIRAIGKPAAKACSSGLEKGIENSVRQPT